MARHGILRDGRAHGLTWSRVRMTIMPHDVGSYSVSIEAGSCLCHLHSV